MTANELIKELQLPVNTWDIPVLVEGREIKEVDLIYDKGTWHVELKLKPRRSVKPQELLKQVYECYKKEITDNPLSYDEWVKRTLNEDNAYFI